MAMITAVTLGGADTAAAESFYRALGVSDHVRVRVSDEPTSGFRGYTLSLVVSQPDNVDAFVSTALDAGATTIKPASKSFWGYGAVVQAPDGAIWTIASSSKKNIAPPSREFDQLVLLLGVAEVKATKQFYVERGLAVGKSFGSKYVEFDTPESPINLALYGRRAAAKNAGVAPEGTGSSRLVVVGDLGAFTDPDGFVWESADARDGSVTQ